MLCLIEPPKTMQCVCQNNFELVRMSNLPSIRIVLIQHESECWEFVIQP